MNIALSIYPTGLRDKRKTTLRQGVSCSINCVLPAGKSVSFKSFYSVIFYHLIFLNLCYGFNFYCILVLGGPLVY